MPVPLPTVAPPHWSLRRRVLTALGALWAVQAAIVLFLGWRSRERERRRAARRPKHYRSRRFEPVELEHGIETLKPYMESQELIDDIVAAVDAAKQSVYLETFIWNDDVVGRRLRDALVRASERGLSVRAMYDGLGSIHLPDGFLPGRVETIEFKPLGLRPGTLRPHNLLRDHRKVVVCDDEVAFVGGFNFGEGYASWRDTHVRLVGASCREVANAFGDFWNTHRGGGTTPVPEHGSRDWDPHVVVHRNDPSLGIFPIRGMYLEAIDRAASHIWMTAAYFVPDRAFRAGLVAAARRGVEVRVILPEMSNHPLTDVLAQGLFDDLLAAGVRIFLYRDFMMHAKTTTIDGRWSTVGTANIDRWSMLGNYEINLEVTSSAFATQLEEMFELDLESCIEVERDRWACRPWASRAGERVLRSLAPLV